MEESQTATPQGRDSDFLLARPVSEAPVQSQLFEMRDLSFPEEETKLPPPPQPLPASRPPQPPPQQRPEAPVSYPDLGVRGGSGPVQGQQGNERQQAGQQAGTGNQPQQGNQGYQQPRPQSISAPIVHCSNCSLPMIYPPGAYVVRCPRCAVITAVQTLRKMMCPYCRIIMMFPTDAKLVRCTCANVFATCSGQVPILRR